MTTEQAAASFNPDDASGLLDDARVKITKAAVGTFTAKSGKNVGQTYVNLDVTFVGGGQETIEHYMIGDATQWAPNAAKTGVVPIGREGGKLWSKSDAVKFTKSLIDAGVPKALIGNDVTVIEGLDVHVTRVTDGRTYEAKDGKQRANSTLLVSKIYTPVDQIGKTSGKGVTAAAGGGKKPVAARPAAAAAPTGGSGAADVDAVATDTLIGILANGPLTLDNIDQPAFLALTKAKKAAIRPQVIERMKDAAFLGTLVDGGLVTFDGQEVGIAT